MAVQIVPQNFGQVCNKICELVAYPQTPDPAGSPDLKHGQVRAAVNDALQELLNIYDWQDLTKDGTITVVADYPGQKEKAYSLPDDFYRFIDQTQWGSQQMYPAGGPISPQHWKAYIVEGANPSLTLYWQIRQDKIWFLAPPVAPQDFTFFYLSVAQVIDETNIALLKNVAQKNGDAFLLDSYLITLLGRKKWLEWNSMDTGAATADFNTAFNSRVGADKGAPVLNLNRRWTYPFAPVGISGLGAPAPATGVDPAGFYTKAEAEARFLDPLEANALYEPQLGQPPTDGYVLASDRDGTRRWVSIASGGGTVAASEVVVTPVGNISSTDVQAALQELDAEKLGAGSTFSATSVTNTPAGNIAATDVQAALNELDTEKAAVGHTHSAASISNAPAGNIAATTVQAALNELDSEKAALAHTQPATSVTNTPAGNIAATDVQAALNELDSEKAPKADPTFTGRATFQGYKETVITATGAAFSPDPTQGTMFVYTTNANATLTLPTPVAGVSYTVDIIFGGAHTLAFAGGGTIRWPGGTAPTPTSATGKRDSFGFKSTDTTNTHAGVIGQNYAA